MTQHFQNHSRTSIAAIALATLACIFSPASHAAPVENVLQGSVLSVSGVDPATEGALGALGVTDNAQATMIFEVESTTPGTNGPSGTLYEDAITRWTVEIGGFLATFDPARFNNIIVTNDASTVPGVPAVDLYTAQGEMDTTNDVLGSFASAVLQLSEFGSGAISDEAVDQNLSRFDTGSVALAGPDGAISVLFGGLGPGPGPGGPARSRCVRTQIGAGGALCRAVLACWAKFAKSSTFDLLGCITKAEQTFVGNFDGAGSRPGAACESVVDGQTAVTALAADVSPVEALVTANADPNSATDRKYRSAIFKASSNAVKKALKAHAKDAKKPKPAKLLKKLLKNDASLRKKVEKAGKKAQKKGLTPNVSAQAVVDAANDLVDSVLDIASGTP